MIERSILEAMRGAEKGSSQELHGLALQAQLRAALRNGFQDPPANLLERVVVVESQFTLKERKVLKEDGAVTYFLTGETIKGQREAGRKFWYVASGGDRLVALPSRLIEVAVYPNPRKFFVPGTLGKPKDQIEALVAQDGEKLRKTLGLKDIDVILPRAPEAAEVLFKHFDLTNERLLGEKYNFLYMITNTPTNESGSHVANVGSFYADDGPSVLGWPVVEGSAALGAARWVVKKGIR